jgi:hypothetical protein
MHWIRRKTKYAKHARAHRDHVAQQLAKVDASLATLATEYCPPDTLSEKNKEGKKRKSTEGGTEAKKKAASEKGKQLASMTPAEREETAMESLRNYIQEVGGKRFQRLCLGHLSCTLAQHGLSTARFC